MKRLRLKPIPFYIQMTVLLPIVLMLLLLFGVLVFNRMQQMLVIEEEIQVDERVPPVSVLCILHEQETAFFTVVTVDVSANKVMATSLLDEQTAQIYHEKGAAVLLEHIQQQGGVIQYYIDITFDEMREWLQYLGSGVTVTLEEVMYYTDSSGLTITFPTGTVVLSANQTADMLRAVATRPRAYVTVEEMWENVVKRYVVRDRDLLSDYTALTDIGDTDIYIYDFHKALPHLKKMAEKY